MRVEDINTPAPSSARTWGLAKLKRMIILWIPNPMNCSPAGTELSRQLMKTAWIPLLSPAARSGSSPAFIYIAKALKLAEVEHVCAVCCFHRSAGVVNITQTTPQWCLLASTDTAHYTEVSRIAFCSLTKKKGKHPLQTNTRNEFSSLEKLCCLWQTCHYTE